MNEGCWNPWRILLLLEIVPTIGCPIVNETEYWLLKRPPPLDITSDFISWAVILKERRQKIKSNKFFFFFCKGTMYSC